MTEKKIKCGNISVLLGCPYRKIDGACAWDGECHLQMEDGAPQQSDVEKLIDGILDTNCIYYDDPNGGYTYTCPFCRADVETNNFRTIVTMHDLKHDEKTCVWLLAKNLSAKL